MTNNLSHLRRSCILIIRTLAGDMITPGAPGKHTFTVLPMMVPLTIVGLTTNLAFDTKYWSPQMEEEDDNQV